MATDYQLPPGIERRVEGKVRQKVVYSCTVCGLTCLPGVSQVEMHVQSARHARAAECVRRGESVAENLAATARAERQPPPAYKARHDRQKQLLSQLSTATAAAAAVNDFWFWGLPYHCRRKR